MVEGGFIPSIRSMAGRTIRTKLPIVVIITRMAGITILRRTFVPAPNMTGSTSNRSVFTSQRERCFGVLEGCRKPAIGCMARCTIGTELTTMVIIFYMTGIAILRRALEISIHMTGCTIHATVFTNQRKCCGRMVQGDLAPTRCGMAGSTFSSELAFMFIILRMTGKTIFRRAYIPPSRMAARTTCTKMLTRQFVGGR